MSGDAIRVGQQRPTRMRRIGSRHMIVLPQQVAKVMSVDDLENTLRVAKQQEQATQAQLDRHRAFILDLESQLRAFNALPVERVEDDPDVPQPVARAPRPVAEDPSRHLAGVTPTGYGRVPEGATPLPAVEALDAKP